MKDKKKILKEIKDNSIEIDRIYKELQENQKNQGSSLDDMNTKRILNNCYFNNNNYLRACLFLNILKDVLPKFLNKKIDAKTSNRIKAEIEKEVILLGLKNITFNIDNNFSFTKLVFTIDYAYNIDFFIDYYENNDKNENNHRYCLFDFDNKIVPNAIENFFCNVKYIDEIPNFIQTHKNMYKAIELKRLELNNLINKFNCNLPLKDYKINVINDFYPTKKFFIE